jgi:hypothetical protein
MALSTASVLLAGLGMGAQGAYQCTSDVTLPIVHSTQKGLALDDTTFHWCPDQIPGSWPNTNEPVTSIRIFKAWENDWYGTSNKTKAWENIVSFAKASNAKVLLGTQVSCSEVDDDADWADVMSLVKMLGPDHVMGIAIGNELDLMWQQKEGTPECVQNLWKGGYFQKKFDSRVADLDATEGFQNGQIPVTTVLSEYSLAGKPFVDDPSKAMVNTFLSQMTAKHHQRFVFSFNNYPYFDLSNQYLNLTAALDRDTCFNKDSCLFADVTKTFRGRMQTLTNRADYKLWIGETGWSSPTAQTLPAPMNKWPEYSNVAALRRTYQNFLSWDMTIDGLKGPDHVFYFAMRDAPAFGGIMEGFGLIGNELGDQHLCQETKCKIQSTSSVIV